MQDVLANLIVVAIPSFLAAVIRVFGTFVGIPPLPVYPNTTNYPTHINPLVVTCAVVVPLDSLLAQYGVVDVAVKADASLNQGLERFDQGERLDSIDVVLMDRDPTMAHEAPAGLETR